MVVTVAAAKLAFTRSALLNMVTRTQIQISVPGVAAVAVPVPVPIAQWSIFHRLAIANNEALISIPSLSLVDVPAPLLRRAFFNQIYAPLSNIDFLVRLASGTEDVLGELTVFTAEPAPL